MKGPTTVLRMLYGVTLSAALAACSDTPLAPADDPAVNLAKGGATFTEFTATDVGAGVVDPGLVEPRDEYLVMRGMVVNTWITADQPGLSCFSTITINANLLLVDGTGSLWGKLDCVPLSGEGVWQGSWTGKRQFTPPGTWLTTMKIVLQGRGGDIDGLQVRAEELNVNTFGTEYFAGPYGLYPFGTISGTILDPL